MRGFVFIYDVVVRSTKYEACMHQSKGVAEIQGKRTLVLRIIKEAKYTCVIFPHHYIGDPVLRERFPEIRQHNNLLDSMDNNPNIPTHAQVNAVALKLPMFWPTAPEVWFMQAEAEFDIKGITGESTKFSYLVASLPQDVARQTLTTATDLARNPNRYTALKERLMVAYSLTPYQRACQLLDGTNIGNQRPSAMLREMQAIRGDDKTDLFTALFLRRLTEDVRALLSTVVRRK